MLSRCPSRPSPLGAMLFTVFALTLAGCATTPDTPVEAPAPLPPSGEEVTEGDPIARLLLNLPTDSTLLGPTAESFIGQPIAKLEQVTGPAALTRREGKNEFRRYDLGPCRAYAVVSPAGGNVTSLTTGAAVAGYRAPAFERCTARQPGS